ncbi:MAG: N-formylglutamate amidohydrolase [Alphaproteobacteria bacterium]|nr:N-formylglutamate amidohydrolase [Alphaproteobacteria bacterium]
MDGFVDAARGPSPIALNAPDNPSLPIVLASPHSGRRYTPEFLALVEVPEAELRRAEDAFVDRLLSAAPGLGVPLLAAKFPRSMVDVNREALELDPEMFEGTLPPEANTRSPRVVAGLGSIPRLSAGGRPLYRCLLPVSVAMTAIERLWQPYHRSLAGLVASAQAAFGVTLLLDCHSMPSAGGLGDTAGGETLADIVLGDAFGQSCDPRLVEGAETFLAGRGYTVVRNAPYAGGYTTRHYGRPAEGVHALQIEVSRALYLDEARIEPTAAFAKVSRDLLGLVETLGRTTLELSRRT